MGWTRSREALSPDEATVAETTAAQAYEAEEGVTMQAGKGMYKSKLSRLVVRSHQAAGWAKVARDAGAEDDGGATGNAIPHLKDKEELKHAQAFKKREQIAKGQLDPDGQMDMKSSVDKHGLCEDMCPELERVRRIVQNDVAGPEYTEDTAHGPRNQRIIDEARMIAAHHRSSAGEDLTLMSDLRTPAALHKSMTTMIERLKGDSFEFLNGWIWDRSRAVRVEINKNYRRREDTEPFLGCYEMCIRFHLLSMHQMAKSKSGDYDRHTDWEQLSASCYQITQLWDKIKVYVPEDGVTPSPLEASRVAEIHAYNIILGLKEREHREEVRRHPRVRTAQFLVRAAHDTKNFATFWRLVRSSQVSYLMACAAATRFMSVRSDTLEAMVKAYMVHKQKVDDWTLEKLAELLGFDGEEQVRTFCQAYGGEFEINPQGVTYLRPETITMRKDPFGKKHFFSQKYVEFKRGGRNLAAVLLGYNMLEAQSKGLLEPISENDEDSLFVPDSFAPPNPSNPFALAAAAHSSTQPSKLFSSSIQPGLFDAKKNSVKFATPPNDAPSSASAPANPFAAAATKLNGSGQVTAPTSGSPTSSSGFPVPATTASSGLSAKANAFLPSANANPFGFPAGQRGLGARTTAHGAETSVPATSIFSTSSAPSNAFARFKLPDFANTSNEPATSSAPTNGFTGLATSGAPSAAPIRSGTPTAGLAFSGPAGTSISPPSEDEKRKAFEEEQRKAREKEQRRVQEEQRRAAEERRQRAEEEQQRKIQEEQAKARAAEEQRRLQEEKEREQLRAQQEEARQAEEQRRQALTTLTFNLLEDPREGLMKQYLANMVEALVKDTKAALRKERQAQDDAMADEMWQRKRLNLARAAFYRWAQHVHKKRRLAEARHLRERRRKLKAEIEAAKSSAASSAASPPASDLRAVESMAPVDRPVAARANGLSSGAPRRTQSQRTSQQTSQPARRNGEAFTQSTRAFSQSYHEARAHLNERRGTVDRTETDYFRLRASGIDPNKLRKRNLDSSDEEDVPKADNKRARTSTSSTAQQPTTIVRKIPPPPSTDEERIARFRAIKESMSKNGHSSGHTPSRSVDFNSVRMSTFNASTTSRFNASTTNQIIQRARETLAQPPPFASRQSTPDVGFAHSTGTPFSSDKPAYWARQSRFVPQHLYGQPEAIRAYRAQFSGRSPASSQASPDVVQFKDVPNPPNFLSSPIPTQQSYYPTQQQQSFENEAEGAIDIQDDADGEDEGGAEYDEHEEFDEEGEEQIEEEEEYYSEDEGEEYSGEEEEEEGTECAQQPGGTENDAIELSD
ncbi:actin cytoskeleton and mitosis protein [Didymosphaeria variabile]|uniref:Actin cytoskeleton and mitosis protein n=1 Tax=Didymosphaeria variabile TaxID=1932322 RepID=A0A9W8XL24_9PLEO|nr:actin cytoskeleton and mitosis protein [Didymosphaeria variabile]KAJ4353877.1 actin cytoskeleton and mitosis protein [Didymosphaeria variabile]